MANEKRPLTPAEIEFIGAMHHAAMDGTYYDVLGVHVASTASEIETAYLDIARNWHPDRFFSRKNEDYATMIDENFAVATRAYRTLREAHKRVLYDRELADAGRSAPQPPRDPTAPTREPTIPTGSPSGPSSFPSQPAQRGRPDPLQHEVDYRPGSAPTTAKPRMKAPPAVTRHLQAIAEHRKKAEHHYDAAKAAFDAGQFSKAESAAYLATTIDTRSKAFRELYEASRLKAKDQRAVVMLGQAETAEQYGKPKEAMAILKQAADLDPAEGAVFYRLAQLMRAHDEDERTALSYLRKAAQKEPKNVKYRLGLAEMYASINLKANAQREVQAVLEIDPGNAAAKALSRKVR